MTVRIEAPQMGESINEATVASWAKKEGDMVQEDELIAELETEKINLEVTAPKAGKLVKISVQEGDTISPGDLMGEIDDSASGDDSSDDSADEDKDDKKDKDKDKDEDEESSEEKSEEKSESKSEEKKSSADDKALDDLAPSVRRLVVENDLDPSKIDGTGKGGRITKEDVLQFMDGDKGDSKSADKAPEIEKVDGPKATTAEGKEERVRMSALRKTIARRLKEAQDTAAMLTTFNEVDLYEVMQLRKKYKEMFKDRHEVGLGFMSFFTKAVIAALKDIPALNAEIDGDDIVYKKHYDIGIAVSTERGLMVPVIRNADELSFAGVEQAIAEYGQKARKNKIMPDDLIGGTFTITNGGIFGSMLSTPILNTPQVGILGMHNIKERAVVIDGEIQVRPMMYLALSYDHRIVDGKEAVTFLVKIKEALEDPARLMIEV